MADWSYLGGGHPGTAPGTTMQIGPGGLGAGGTRLRDGLDARRTGSPQGPGSDWPDGYLGTIQSRREDRLLDNLKTRQNQRAYQRGVHKGERIDASDYFWGNEFGVMSGIDRQTRALMDDSTGGVVYQTPKQAPLMTIAEELTAFGDTLPARARDGSTAVRVIDPTRRAALGRLAPDWR